VHEKVGFIEFFFLILASNKTISRWLWSCFFVKKSLMFGKLRFISTWKKWRFKLFHLRISWVIHR
jgi:hypothetical protein